MVVSIELSQMLNSPPKVHLVSRTTLRYISKKSFRNGDKTKHKKKNWKKILQMFWRSKKLYAYIVTSLAEGCDCLSVILITRHYSQLCPFQIWFILMNQSKFKYDFVFFSSFKYWAHRTICNVALCLLFTNCTCNDTTSLWRSIQTFTDSILINLCLRRRQMIKLKSFI